MDKRILTRRALAALACGIGLGSVSHAQTLLRTKLGAKANDRLGASLASIGDVNNDGRPDYIVGSPENASVFNLAEGFAEVLSGATGLPIYTIDGIALGEYVGSAVSSAGDVNNDGTDDFIIGAPNSGMGGEVRVFSGATGNMLWSRLGAEQDAEFGTAVSDAGDVNGDGFDDVLVGAPESGGGLANGQVFVLSGSNGSILHTLTGPINSGIGVAMARLGDVNNDTHSDFIVGSRAGGVFVHSGINAAQLFMFSGLVTDSFGHSVAGMNDVNGDGVRDILIGAPQDIDFFFPGPGYAQVRSGANGGLLMTLTGDVNGDVFGASIADAGDFNADGTPDIVVGATQSSNALNGYARLFSGADGSVIGTVTGLAGFDRFGWSVDGVGDVDGDGAVEVAIGAPGHDPAGMNAAGMVRLYSGTPGGPVCGAPTIYCSTTPNSAGGGALMSYSGTVSIAANDLTLLANGCPPNSQGLFVQGDGNGTMPIGDGTLCVAGGSVVLRILPGLNTGPAGVASRLLDYNSPITPGSAITAGSTWNFQFWYRDPGFGAFGYNLSDALSVTFCP